MTPPRAATANPLARRHGVDARTRPGAGSVSTRPAPLRVVRSRGDRADRDLGKPRNPNRLLHIVSIALIVGALLAVVVGQALLANRQVRLSSVQHQLALAQSSHRQAELAVSQLETPSRIVAAASVQLHMVGPAQVVELPYVSLSTPLPPPKVTPQPGGPATAAPAAGGSAQTTSTSTP